LSRIEGAPGKLSLGLLPDVETVKEAGVQFPSPCGEDSLVLAEIVFIMSGHFTDGRKFATEGIENIVRSNKGTYIMERLIFHGYAPIHIVYHVVCDLVKTIGGPVEV
jgi:hypothetical protein